MPNYTTFSVLFFVRKHHNGTKKLFIYARVTVDGKRSEISLKRSISVNHWDASKGRARGTAPKSRMLNQYLDQVYTKFMDCHKQLSYENKVVSAQSIKARFYGNDEHQKTLLELMSYHNSHMKNVLKPGTMKNYRTTETYLKEFLKHKMKCNDINIKQINYRFVTDFEQFLRNYSAKVSRKTCGNNGTMKHLERFKKMLNLAIKLEWLVKNPFEKFTFHFEKNERQYVSKQELQLLEETSFTSSTLQKVKDVFVFSCYTGLSYIDIKELTVHQIVRGIDGNNWIYTKREKTDETVKVPLLPQAESIMDQYAESMKDDFLFPVFSNQKVNKYLKEIFKQLKIRKNITFHSARHTFATTVTLSNGVPIETVSKLLGHTKLSTTQIYARVIDSKISSDIDILRKRLKD